MHIPSHFKIEDPLIIDQFIQDHGFATLISQGSPYPLATHIPLELETLPSGIQILHGHMSKSNPQWTYFAGHPFVLAVFMSPVHQYISSSWYRHANVSTWNYLSVQVSGRIRLIEGEKLKEALRRLTHKYEKHSEQPLEFDQLPPSVQNQMQGVAGFEIEIEKKEASFKLSQNRNEEDFANIIRELRKKENPEADKMAELMIAAAQSKSNHV